MIHRWALPGLASAVAGIADRIADGENIVFYGPSDFELRLALEPRLNEAQRQLRPVLDDHRSPPSSVLWRETSEWSVPTKSAASLGPLISALGCDTWWIENVPKERATDWSAFLITFAEATRNTTARQRPTLVLCLPESTNCPLALTITQQEIPKLSRVDLEVAARYRAAPLPHDLFVAVRIELAVEMASYFLPNSSALETIEMWLEAPRSALTDPRALLTYSGRNMSLSEAASILWRAQHAPVSLAIDKVRSSLVKKHPTLWRVPYTRPVGHAFPAIIENENQLELSDLVDQLTGTSFSRRPLFADLRALRNARNKLSHLAYVSESVFQLIERVQHGTVNP